jgi:hypothetical protein
MAILSFRAGLLAIACGSLIGVISFYFADGYCETRAKREPAFLRATVIRVRIIGTFLVAERNYAGYTNEYDGLTMLYENWLYPLSHSSFIAAERDCF